MAPPKRAAENDRSRWMFIALNPFRTAVPFGDKTTWNLTGLSPERDCGSKRVNRLWYEHNKRERPAGIVRKGRIMLLDCARVVQTGSHVHRFVSRPTRAAVSARSPVCCCNHHLINYFDRQLLLSSLTLQEGGGSRPILYNTPCIIIPGWYTIKLLLLFLPSIWQCAAWSSTWITHNFPENKKNLGNKK